MDCRRRNMGKISTCIVAGIVAALPAALWRLHLATVKLPCCIIALNSNNNQPAATQQHHFMAAIIVNVEQSTCWSCCGSQDATSTKSDRQDCDGQCCHRQLVVVCIFSVAKQCCGMLSFLQSNAIADAMLKLTVLPSPASPPVTLQKISPARLLSGHCHHSFDSDSAPVVAVPPACC